MLTDEEKEKVISYLPADMAVSSRVNTWLEMASVRVSKPYFGSSYCLALSFMVAHIAQLEIASQTSRESGSAGVVTSMREGDVSVSYAGGNQDITDSLTSTSYGLQFKDLFDSKRKKPFVTGMMISGV